MFPFTRTVLADQRSRAAGLTVMIVAHELAIIEALKAHLTDNGHNVLGVCCRDHAGIFKTVDHARWMRFDVAFIGTVMPLDAGPLIAGCVKWVSPATRIVFIAEQLNPKEAAFLQSDGIEFDTLTAPFEHQEILNLLGKYKIAGPVVCEDEPVVRGSTEKMMLAHADNLKRRAQVRYMICQWIKQEMEGQHVEITDEDFQF